jgi:hypothetical protein
MTINVVSQITNQITNNRTRVEFRFIGGSNATPLDDLSNIESVVRSYIYTNILDMPFYKSEK